MQTVYILSGKIGEMKNEKRNDMGVGVYGCMPSGGGGEKKCTHTRKRMFLVWAQWGVSGLSLIQFVKKR